MLNDMGIFSARGLRYRIAELLVALFGHKKVFSLGPEELRDYLERNKAKQYKGPPAYIGKKHDLTREVLAGWPVYIISPKGPVTKQPIARRNIAGTRAALFIHGGGYILGAHAVHWRAASRLAGACGIPVWFADYPLLPDHPIEEAGAFLAAVYAKMSQTYSAGEIAVIGDSAGADLSLSLCHHINRREKSLPMPGKLILVSPVSMIEEDETIHDAMRRAAKRDVMVSAELFNTAAEVFGMTADKENYYNCPLQGDFSRFPPMYIFSGTFECGFPQIEAFAARLKAAGLEPEFHIGKEMMHIWPYIPAAPECRKAFKLLCDIIRR